MTVTISGVQLERLSHGIIEPRLLVDITNTSGTLRFTNSNAFIYQGNVYQPFINGFGGARSSATFPENKAEVQEVRLEFQNTLFSHNDVVYPYLSQALDVFDWELSDCDIKLLLSSGTSESSIDVAIPIMTSGIVGTPNGITREKFSLPIFTRNQKLNDLIPLRTVSTVDFPEADRDELNGRTYLPIVVGSGIRIRAIATEAGATTSVRTTTSGGTALPVSETEGFNNGDTIFIGGLVDFPFVIGTVDAANNQFTGLSPALTTLPAGAQVGDIVIEDKAAYKYTLADHATGSVNAVYVYRTGEDEPVLIDSSKYSKTNVVDAKSIGGFRSELSITELTPLGQPTFAQISAQPVHTVNNANHVHDVGVTVTQETTSITFSNSVDPSGDTAANDGSDITSATVSHGLPLTYDSFDTVGGTFVRDRFFMIIQDTVSTGEFRIRKGTTNMLIVTGAMAKAELRTGTQTTGDSTNTWNVIVNDSPSGTLDLFEGWKELTINPDTAVSETAKDLTATTRTVNVALNSSGANLEIGERVEVVMDGLQAEDWPNADLLGISGTISRPDYLYKWFLLEALEQTPAIYSTPAYDSAGLEYTTSGIALRYAIQQPMKLDAVFDMMADNSRSIHFWGFEGHKIKMLEPSANIPAEVAQYEEDAAGVTEISWQNATSIADIRNKITAAYDRDWTQASVAKDEAYSGKLEVTSSGSIARFGEITNEVRDGTKDFYFDFTHSDAQANLLLDFIGAHKAEPKKLFTVQTDWSQLIREPGDIVDVRPVTTLNSTFARVIDAQSDPNFFSTVTAIEIADSPVETTVTPDVLNPINSIWTQDWPTQQFANLTTQDLGFANAWTIMYRFKQNSSPGATTHTMLDISDGATNVNRIRITNKQTAGSRDLTIHVYGSSGSTSDHKQYVYTNFMNAFGFWYKWYITWDGTNLNLFEDNYAGPIPAVVPVDVFLDDDTLTMTNTSRQILIPCMDNAKYHDMAFWNVALSSGTLNAISVGSGKEHSLDSDGGLYTSSANLKHWWRFGYNNNHIGHDWANGGTIDLLQDSAGIGPSQISPEQPS